jgi:hypothetical protein
MTMPDLGCSSGSKKGTSKLSVGALGVDDAGAIVFGACTLLQEQEEERESQFEQMKKNNGETQHNNNRTFPQ